MIHQHKWHTKITCIILHENISEKGIWRKGVQFQTSQEICTNTNVTGPKSQMNSTKQFNCLMYNIVYIIHCTIHCTKCTLHQWNWTHPWHLFQRTPCGHYTPETNLLLGTWTKLSTPSTTFMQKDCGFSLHSANDRNDKKSHLTDKLGSRKPGGSECKTTICGSH